MAHPKPGQKELNEFVLDLVEFLGKHFPACLGKTRVAGGNQDVSVLIRNLKTGSELEISTERRVLALKSASVDRAYREDVSKEALFARFASDLMAILTGEMPAVRGPDPDQPGLRKQ